MSETGWPLLLLGGGGHAAVVAESARAAGWNVLGCLDDEQGSEAASGLVALTRLGRLDQCRDILAAHPDGTRIHAAVGDANLRRNWLDAFRDIPIATVIDPSANVSPSVQTDDGVFIGPRAVINARARIGRGVIVNTFAIVEHDCKIGAFSHIAPRAVLCGGVVVGEGSLIGAGAIVCPGTTINPRATLGAGAVATTDIPGDCTSTGVPARVLGAPVIQDTHRSGR